MANRTTVRAFAHKLLRSSEDEKTQAGALIIVLCALLDTRDDTIRDLLPRRKTNDRKQASDYAHRVAYNRKQNASVAGDLCPACGGYYQHEPECKGLAEGGNR